MSDGGLNDLLSIFNIRRKSELKAHCRAAVISRNDLANLILACGVGAVPIIHVRTHRHHHPAHLWPTDAEREALGISKPGPVKGEAAKFIRKIHQLTDERRLFNAHLFLPVFHETHWHLFYFDQRDTAGDHWKQGGSHIHLINMLTHPSFTLEALDQELRKEKPHFSGGLHIRFQRQSSDQG